MNTLNILIFYDYYMLYFINNVHYGVLVNIVKTPHSLFSVLDVIKLCGVIRPTQNLLPFGIVKILNSVYPGLQSLRFVVGLLEEDGMGVPANHVRIGSRVVPPSRTEFQVLDSFRVNCGIW